MNFLTRLIKQIHFWRISCLLVADVLLFGTTNPDSTLSFMLIVGFVLLCTTVYYLLDGLLAFAKLYGLSLKHRKRFIRTMTALFGGLVALQSIGQLSPRDVVVLSPLTVLLYLYIAYSRSTKQNLSTKRT